MPRRGIARCLAQLLCKGLIDRQIEIGYPSAALADEVMVRQDGSLEPVETIAKVEPAHEPLFHKDAQVPIDGAQAQVRKLLFHLVEQPLCRGVAPGLSKGFEYAIALPTLASSSRHALARPSESFVLRNRY